MHLLSIPKVIFVSIYKYCNNYLEFSNITECVIHELILTKRNML